MAMQVKHMVTFGLGLGIATALGYHFLSSPQDQAESLGSSQLTPLKDFEIAPAPLAIADANPVPVQPQLDNHFRVEVQPLQSQAIQAMPVAPKTSYEELVSAMQPVSPGSTSPDQATTEVGDSDNSFSLDLNGPSNNEPEFAFDDSQQSKPQMDVQSDENSLDLGTPYAELLRDAEALEVADHSPAVDEILADDETFAASSAQTVPIQNQDKSFTDVVDYNSKPITGSNDQAQEIQSAKAPRKNLWKENPFINAAPAMAKTAKTVEPDPKPILSLAEADVSQPAPVATIESVSPVQQVSPAEQNSVLSLNDPAQQPLSAAVTQEVVQPYRQPALVNDRVSTQSAQIAPQAQLALSGAAAQKAVHHIEYGKTLSRRGAAFTARQEFLAAMQVIAAANDNVSGDNRYTKALRMAMLAIKEAGDFSVASSEQQIHMDVASVVESHRSQILTLAQAANLSPTQAMNRYFARAQEQLDLAGGRNVVSAEVFYCMGKLHTLLNRNQKVLGPYQTAQSVVYHQAALLSDNQHHRSANELGVLLARSGRLEQSKMRFERSLISQPTVRTWQNLAEAHRRLGESEFASRATSEMQLLANGQVSTVDSNIQWKPVEVFNADAPVEFNPQRVAQLPAPPQPTPAATPSNSAPGKPSPAKAFAEKLKGIF